MDERGINNCLVILLIVAHLINFDHFQEFYLFIKMNYFSTAPEEDDALDQLFCVLSVTARTQRCRMAYVTRPRMVFKVRSSTPVIRGHAFGGKRHAFF